jgi:hypothetical protein
MASKLNMNMFSKCLEERLYPIATDHKYDNLTEEREYQPGHIGALRYSGKAKLYAMMNMLPYGAARVLYLGGAPGHSLFSWLGERDRNAPGINVVVVDPAAMQPGEVWEQISPNCWTYGKHSITHIRREWKGAAKKEDRNLRTWCDSLISDIRSGERDEQVAADMEMQMKAYTMGAHVPTILKFRLPYKSEDYVPYLTGHLVLQPAAGVKSSELRLCVTDSRLQKYNARQIERRMYAWNTGDRLTRRLFVTSQVGEMGWDEASLAMAIWANLYASDPMRILEKAPRQTKGLVANHWAFKTSSYEQTRQLRAAMNRGRVIDEAPALPIRVSVPCNDPPVPVSAEAESSNSHEKGKAKVGDQVIPEPVIIDYGDCVGSWGDFESPRIEKLILGSGRQTR